MYGKYVFVIRIRIFGKSISPNERHKKDKVALCLFSSISIPHIFLLKEPPPTYTLYPFLSVHCCWSSSNVQQQAHHTFQLANGWVKLVFTSTRTCSFWHASVNNASSLKGWLNYHSINRTCRQLVDYWVSFWPSLCFYKYNQVRSTTVLIDTGVLTENGDFLFSSFEMRGHVWIVECIVRHIVTCWSPSIGFIFVTEDDPRIKMP